MWRLMRLIVFSHPDSVKNEADILISLFENGLKILHLRKPNMDLENYLKLINNIPSEFYNRIVIHNHYEIMENFNFAGFHVNISKHINILRLREIGNKILSCSCHSFDEVVMNKNLFTYIFLSPIFNSISKGEYNSKFTEEALLKAKNEGIIDQKVIALGGIKSDNLEKIYKYGFGGAAVLGAIWQTTASNTINNFKKLKEKSNRHE